MQPKRTRSSRPKVFQCTGYGDCNMVFTRSEHLARHSRKHTGEKPFVCIVPLCTKAFSRFDNMMQHTQTHRNNSYNIISNPNTRSTRASSQRKKEQSCESPSKKNNNLQIDTTTKDQLTSSPSASSSHNNSGLISPISLSSSASSVSASKRSRHSSTTSSYTSFSSDEDDEESVHLMSPSQKRRKLSIAELCNPTTSCVFLTKDEFEVLEAFDQFRHTPTVFY